MEPDSQANNHIDRTVLVTTGHRFRHSGQTARSVTVRTEPFWILMETEPDYVTSYHMDRNILASNIQEIIFKEILPKLLFF
jgi:hypothetical protein